MDVFARLWVTNVAKEICQDNGASARGLEPVERTSTRLFGRATAGSGTNALGMLVSTPEMDAKRVRINANAGSFVASKLTRVETPCSLVDFLRGKNRVKCHPKKTFWSF